jgi:hypothetical protein
VSSPSDLSTLFGGGEPGVGFRQGVVVTWNTATGENSVNVGGTVLQNLPILNTSESIALKPGVAVGLLQFQTSFFILGRITLPNDPDFASAAVEFAGAYNLTDSFNITTTPTIRAEIEIPVPTWADQALVYAASTATGVNGQATRDFIRCETIIEGSLFTYMPGSATQNDLANVTSTASTVLDALDDTITIQTQVYSALGTWTAGSGGAPVFFNSADVSASVVFRNKIG